MGVGHRAAALDSTAVVPAISMYTKRCHFHPLVGQEMDKPSNWHSQSHKQVSGHSCATNLPDLPPCFSSSFTSVMVMPRSTALHIS